MYLGYGIIGGKMTSSRMHGELAARMLLSIFEGKNPGVFKEPLTRYVFDYSLIKKFGIPNALIPPGSELMNRPLSFLESYGRVLALIFGLFFSLLMIIFILSSNIRMRRKAEARLQKANDDLSVTLDSIGDGVIVTDETGHVLRMNPIAASLTGYPPSEAMGKSLDLIFPIFDAGGEKPLGNPVREVLRTGRGLSLSNHALLRNREGLSFHVANSASPILRREGDAIGAVLVFRDVTEKHSQERELKASLEEKEILLKEIHHRVKNNLQIVSSLLSLQSQQAESEPLQAALKESMGRIQTMALIHEHLYRSEDFSKIMLGVYVRSLLDSIFIAFGADGEHIHTRLDVGDIQLPLDQAIPVGLILNEIVTNAVKYAFPEKREGMIGILMTQEGRRVTLIVRDNGVGLPSQVDITTSATLGIRLIKALSDQLDGTVDFKNDNGLVCSLSFESQASES
jgi:PAS domain S-box-containing protein